MKSAIGIGALLMDGLGDTIRVSLTEDPELEIVPCGCPPALQKVLVFLGDAGVALYVSSGDVRLCPFRLKWTILSILW